MADMDDRQPVQILGIRLCRDHMVVIRDKLRVNAGLLADRHDGFQLGELVDTQCDGNFIVCIGTQQILQHRNVSDDGNAAIGIFCAFMVIQNTVDKISPFRMNPETVDIALCRTAVSHQKDVF